MNSSIPSTQPATGGESWQQAVHRLAAGIRFGSVQVTIHDGKVTQVEAVQRTRFQGESVVPSGRQGTRR